MRLLNRIKVQSGRRSGNHAMFLNLFSFPFNNPDLFTVTNIHGMTEIPTITAENRWAVINLVTLKAAVTANLTERAETNSMADTKTAQTLNFIGAIPANVAQLQTFKTTS
jgi:hypothetical protein